MMTDECVDMSVMKLAQIRVKVKRRRCLFYKHSTMLAAKNKLRNWQYVSIEQHFDCGALWRVAQRGGTLLCVAGRCGTLRHLAGRCGVLRNVAACWGALRRVAVRYVTLRETERLTNRHADALIAVASEISM